MSSGPAIRLLVVATLGWFVAVVAVSTRIAVSNSPMRNNVFPVYQQAGRAWLAGADLYRDRALDYRYSPCFAVTMTPFALMPLKFGSVLWRLLSAGAFLAALTWTSWRKIPQAFSPQLYASLLLFVLPLSIGNLNNGQANLFVMAALLVSTAAAVNGSWTLSAVAIVAATIVKAYPIVFGALLFLWWPRKLGWRLALCLVIAAALPFACQHSDYVIRQYRDWANYLITDNRMDRPLSQWYLDLRLLLQAWSIPVSRTAYLILRLLTLIGLGVLVAKLKSTRANLGLFLAWLLSLACCWMTVLGPATESSTYVLIAPATAWSACELLASPATRAETLWVSAIYLLQLVPGIGAWFGGLDGFAVYASPFVLSSLLLAAYLLRPSVFLSLKGQRSAGARPIDKRS